MLVKPSQLVLVESEFTEIGATKKPSCGNWRTILMLFQNINH